MLYPMFTMFLLTLIVGLITVKARFASVKNGDVSIKHYRVMNLEVMPTFVAKTTRNYNNQFEVPVLFYVVCTLFISLDLTSKLAIITAWVFVVSRIFHSIVHITYNNVVHRMLLYWAGIIAVFTLWVVLIAHQV